MIVAKTSKYGMIEETNLMESQKQYNYWNLVAFLFGFLFILAIKRVCKAEKKVE